MRRPTATAPPPQQHVTAADREAIKQWIVYLIGTQPSGPLAGYTADEEKASSSMFGALTAGVSPGRNRGDGGLVPVAKNISTTVMTSLRATESDLGALVKDLSTKNALERDMTKRVRMGETVYEDAPTTPMGREPTVDVEDLDAFLASDSPAAASPAGATTSGRTSAPGIVQGEVRSLGESLCPPPLAYSLEAAKATREVGKAEGDAYHSLALSSDSARRSILVALEGFVGLHNERLLQLFCEGRSGPEASDPNATLLRATSADRLASLVQSRCGDALSAVQEDEAAFKVSSQRLAEELVAAKEAIRECDQLSLKGALAAEMGRIEERLRDASRQGTAVMRAAQSRLETLRPILDGPVPAEEGEGDAFGASTDGSATSSPQPASARDPKDVLSGLTNALKTLVEPFAQRTQDVFMARAVAVEERTESSPTSAGESVVAYQQARRHHLIQQAEDLEAMAGVTDRKLKSLRTIYETRDRPAAQQEHDKWSGYAKSLEAVRDQLQRNYAARVKYDDDTAGLRTAQREKLPPPPARYSVRVPVAPSDPRPDVVRGGLHHLPLTWRERYEKMPPAALLVALPLELRTADQLQEDERRRRSEDAGDDGSPLAVPKGVATDLVAECEHLRQELKTAMTNKKAREQCHAALGRQLGQLLMAASVREESANGPLSPKSQSMASSIDRLAPSASSAAATEARQTLSEVLRRYA